MTVILDGFSGARYGVSGTGGSFDGDGPQVAGELPPGDYSLLTDGANKFPLDYFAECVADGSPLTSFNQVSQTFSIASVASSTVTCNAVMVRDPGGPTTTITPPTTAITPPDALPAAPSVEPEPPTPQEPVYIGPTRNDVIINENADPDEYEAELEDKTYIATAVVKLDGQDPADADAIVEGQEVALSVLLEAIGTGDESDDQLAQLAGGKETVGITALNRVTITCDKVDGDDSVGCPDFDVTPAYQELAWPDAVFDFDFIPRTDGEINFSVRVEGLLQQQVSGNLVRSFPAVKSDFTVVVDVHPQREAWMAFNAALLVEPSLGLAVDVPDGPRTIGEPFQVKSIFTYPAGVEPEGLIGVELLLDTKGWADPVPRGRTVVGQSVQQAWDVTPDKTGQMPLSFSAVAKASILGQDENSEPMETMETLRVNPVPTPTEDKIFSFLDTWMVIVATILGMIASAIAIIQHRRS